MRLADLTNQGNLDADCLRAAPSVTACAVPPSSGRKALVFRAVQLVSPSGRDVAQRQRGLAPSLRELDCRLAARLREFCQSGKIRMRFALIRTCLRAAPSVTACAVPPSSGRKAFVFCAQTKTEHLSILCLLVGGGGFAFLRKSHAGCNMHPACCQEPAFESIAPILNFESKTKTEHLSILCLLVGGGGFEPPKSLTTDLQSAPFGHSGNLPYQLVEIVELVDGLEPPTC